MREAAMTDTNISAEMRGASGGALGWRVSFPVSASDIRRWAIAVYHPARPPEPFRTGSVVAPEEFNPFAWTVAERSSAPPGIDPNDPDRTERLLGIPGPGLKFQLNG